MVIRPFVKTSEIFKAVLCVPSQLGRKTSKNLEGILLRHFKLGSNDNDISLRLSLDQKIYKILIVLCHDSQP